MNRTHNFPDKLTIVLKKKSNQGFIALDKKSIGSGISWAGYYHKSDGEKPYELIEYKNGKFGLKLSKAAERSYSQGGKLSFWTLEVTAPDGRVFDIGIHSDSLIETMFETIVTNGDIEGEFYLGRTNGQQSIARIGSTYYNEYLEVLKTKKQPLTKNYKIGNIIVNSREEYMFVGTCDSFIKIKGPEDRIYSNTNYYISLSKKPKPDTKYLYLRKRYKKETFEDGYTTTYDKKLNGRVVDDKIIREKNEHVLQYIAYLKDNLLTWEDRSYFYIENFLNDYFALKGITEVEDAIKELNKFNLQHLLLQNH